MRTNSEATKKLTFKVLKAHKFDNGDVVFDVEINGVSIYGCRVVEGKNGDFISFPQRKGKDGKYYSIAWVKLDDATTNAILLDIANEL